jgi:hypothetical protein
MDAALVESLQAFSTEVQNQENLIIQSSDAQYDEDQIVQLTIKESLKELPPMIVNDQEEDEEEMLKKALELSQKVPQ